MEFVPTSGVSCNPSTRRAGAEGSEDLELEVSLGRHDRRKGQRDERGGEGRGGRETHGEGIGEGFVLWNILNFPIAMLSFPSLDSELSGFKEVHRYLERELRIWTAWVRM